MSRKKIAVDIDGVLAKTHIQFLEYINSEFHKNFKIEQIKTYEMLEIDSQIPYSVFDQLVSFLKKNIGIIKTYENSFNNLKQLKQNHDLYILTSRNITLKKGTLDWIDKNIGIYLFEEILCLDDTPHDCKSLVCQDYGFDLLIEDAPHYARRTRDLGINVFLFSQPWNEEIDECRILKRVRNWDEISKLL